MNKEEEIRKKVLDYARKGLELQLYGPICRKEEPQFFHKLPSMHSTLKDFDCIGFYPFLI